MTTEDTENTEMATPETDALWHEMTTGNYQASWWVAAECMRDHAKRLERKRASAIRKIQRQAERIRQLEGATNHAGGTPLSIALRELDEARHKLEICMAANSDVARIAKERDEAIKQNAKLQKQIEGLNNFANERFDEIQRVRLERDEAKGEIEAWRNKWTCAVEMAARAENERDEAVRHLRDLLAILHSDGGHHTDNVGLAVSTLDASKKFESLINERENMRTERDEARADAARIADKLSGLELRSTDELERERNEALAQVKELIYISERAIALAESELRDDLAKIKKSK